MLLKKTSIFLSWNNRKTNWLSKTCGSEREYCKLGEQSGHRKQLSGDTVDTTGVTSGKLFLGKQRSQKHSLCFQECDANSNVKVIQIEWCPVCKTGSEALLYYILNCNFFKEDTAGDGRNRWSHICLLWSYFCEGCKITALITDRHRDLARSF